MAKMNFGGVEETVVTRDEFPLEKAREVLKNETIAVIGYGVQGPGQSLNLRDNGFNVIVGQREGKTYDKAVADGWVPGETLFSIEEACERATIIQVLLSDAAQIACWPTIKKHHTALLLPIRSVQVSFLPQMWMLSSLHLRVLVHRSAPCSSRAVA